MEQKEIKVMFAPGCFDDFEGSQEELDSLINETVIGIGLSGVS